MCAQRIEDVVAGSTVTREACGVRLSRTVPAVGAGAAGDLLAQLELSTPGDTRLRAEGDTVAATRFLAEPSEATVHEAAATLAKTVADVHAILGALAARPPVPVSVPEPRFSEPPRMAEVLAGIFTVRTPQPGWRRPDPADPPTGQLLPGAWYEVIERIGDWAKVRGEDGGLVYADFRQLIPVSEGGQR